VRRGWTRLVWVALVVGVALWVVWAQVGLPPVLEMGARPTPAAGVAQFSPARVVRVVDGDTIDVRLDGSQVRVRYIGMDTPERDEAYFRVSTEANRELVDGQTVYLERDVSETDRYGRLLRYVYLGDGRMVNELLVEAGLAHAATFPPDVRYAARLQAAQLRAEDARRGLWAD
jgi:micrococcal nuclease